VIEPTCNGAHVLCQDEDDGTAAVASTDQAERGGGGRHSPAGSRPAPNRRAATSPRSGAAAKRFAARTGNTRRGRKR